MTEIDFIRDINERYLSLEAEMDSKLKEIEEEESKYMAKYNDMNLKAKDNNISIPKTFSEAKQRNKKILDELERAKAHLRSRIIYSPLEHILKKAKRNYLISQRTQIKKKIYGPVFV